jgi:hypothetical protein
MRMSASRTSSSSSLISAYAGLPFFASTKHT